jgi:hypothetical protein
METSTVSRDITAIIVPDHLAKMMEELKDLPNRRECVFRSMFIVCPRIVFGE